MSARERRLVPSLFRAAILTAAILAGGTPGAPSSGSPAGPSIDDLRRSDRYAAALRDARALENSLRKTGARSWRVDDARRLVATLELVITLPDSSRADLAAADRADSLIDACVIRGEYRRARELAERQLAARRRYLGTEHQETARSLGRLADLAMECLAFDLAPDMYSEVLEIQRRLLGDNHPEVAGTLEKLGLALKNRRSRGDLARAEECYRRSHHIRRETLGPDDPAILSSLFHLANLQRSRFDNAAAITGLRDVLARRTRALGDRHPDTIATMALLAYVLQVENRFDEAAPLAARAASLSRTVPGVKMVDRVFALATDAARLWHAGDVAGAERTTTEELSAQEFLRLQNPDDPLRNNHGLVYFSRAALQLFQGKEEEAWRSFERGANRRVLDALAPPDSLDEEARFPTLSEIQAELPDDTALIGWLDQHYGGPFKEIPPWGLVVRRSGRAHWVRLPVPLVGTDTPAGNKQAAALAEALKNASLWAARVPETDDLKRLERDLYEERFRPLLPLLEDVRRIVVIQALSPMAGIPVEILLDSLGVTVTERYEISYVSSGSAMSLMRRRHRGSPEVRRWRALLVGDPVFQRSGEAGPLDAITLRGVLEGDPSAIARLPRLPMTRKEVLDAARGFESPTILLGAAAGAREVRRLVATGDMSQYDLVHFATHALAADGALYGALAFSGETGDPRDPAATPDPANTLNPADILVSAREIASWRLDADLVTLSACQTAGAGAPWEGPVGLGKFFLMAGSRNVLASLWKVDDTATSLLMERFYENLAGAHGRPMSKSASLRDAQLWLRDLPGADGSRPYRHPVYWAGFILVGDALD